MIEKFHVWGEDESTEPELEPREIEAFDAQQAAEEWAEADDCKSAEYSIVRADRPTTVIVRDNQGKVRRFKVHGEFVPQYVAYEIDEG